MGSRSEEAATAFGDPLSRTIPDPDHSEDEERYVLLGETLTGWLVVVVHTERGGHYSHHQRSGRDAQKAKSTRR
jgi:uncharacterized DUF497 family protein